VKTIRNLIQNKSSKKILVFVEPEAMDYWLKPEEELELVADAENETARIEFQYSEKGITAFPSKNCGTIFAYQNGVQLECGFQRPSDW
jgi:hypothetical protein